MDHVAIMKKSWGLLNKILLGEKVIESRWYKTKHSPWGNIHKGDVVYFKNSGEPITISARVQEVLQFDNLTPIIVNELLLKYGELDGIVNDEVSKYYSLFKDKKYCLLVFLQDVKKTTPFEIDKKGFGAMAAWLTTDSIEAIKITKKPRYYVYMLECNDGSFYTGITTDLRRRLDEHNASPLGARYTSARRPVKMVYSKLYYSRSDASKEELRIKKLPKKEKTALKELYN